MGLRKIKNILIILITALLLSAVSLAIIGNINKTNSKSTAANTYEIGNIDTLRKFKNRVNSGESFNGVTVLLTNSFDIGTLDLVDDSQKGIGNYDNSFEGIFDGQGYTLFNYEGENGIFYYNRGTIRNLNVEIRTSSRGGYLGKSGIIIHNHGTVYNCSISAGTNGGIVANSSQIGGIVAWNYGGDIYNCVNMANINCNGKNNVGGIVGINTYQNESGNVNVYNGINNGDITNGKE